MTKKIIFFILFIFALNSASSQEIKQNSKGISIQYDTYLMGHPLLFEKGFSAAYNRPILQNGRHNLSVSPKLGYINLPDIEKKYFLNTSLNYYFLTKRLYSNVGLGVQYTASVLDFKRFEYVDGTLKEQSSVRHNIGSTAHFQLGYRLHWVKNAVISPYFGASITQFNAGYKNALTEGHKLGFSIGINILKN